jgi:hypothetical protein
MIEFDFEGLKALTWVYATREGIITPRSWEKIICESVNGNHILGDTYMADGFKDINGLNIKSIKKKFAKGSIQTLSYIQCRCPLNENQIENANIEIIKTLVDKREESFEKFNLNKMLDVVIIHNRIDSEYNVRLFVTEQLKFEDLNLKWTGQKAYLSNQKSWLIERKHGDASAFQTCISIKKVFDLKNCFANFSVICDNEYGISMKEAKQKYAEVQSK